TKSAAACSRDGTAAFRNTFSAMAAPSAADTAANSRLPAFLRQSKADIHNKFVDLEWQQRNRLLQGTQIPVSDAGSPSQWSRLGGDVVMARNRYLNVEPFASNRIKLKVAEGMSDYINASPIRLGKRRYIATQGPKDTNVSHFWRMVAEEVRGNSGVVVMLTQTHESGKEKCFQYYPLSQQESPLVLSDEQDVADGFSGDVKLLSVEPDIGSRSEVRRLRLRTGDGAGIAAPQEKEIHHLLFSGWPDFLIPEGEDREALIHLIRLSARLNRGPSSNSAAHTNGSSAAEDFSSTDQDNPRIIHCSAGVGRSGTFIALDYLLSLMYAGELDNVPADADPIAETVDLLRQQRMMMVQGESQFNFLYEVLKEQFLARLV
ncbi:hypothetical protein BAUCODRAFT_63248, partial [Baudoinia panamericana UAMH 10762]